MLRKICRFQKCAFSIGFVIGVILACLHINSEKETKCKLEDISEISYRRWFSMQNFKKYPVNYSGTAAAAQISQASYLHNVVHVHCVVFVKKAKNAVAIQNTWAKHCNEIVFFGVKNSSAVSLTVLKPKSSWQYLCDGIRHLWQYNKADLHWALFVPDDVFVVPENLRYYVASLNYNEPHYLGDDVTFWGNVYNVGEAGYVLSKGVIYALQMKFNSSELCHKSGKYWRNEDFYLGKYLGEMGITPADTTDNSGCKRFQRYNVNYVMGTPMHMFSSSAHRLTNHMTPGCYSDKIITFGGIEPDKFYLYDYLLYCVRVVRHGNTLGGLPPTMSVSDDQVWREFVREEGMGEPADISAKQYFELWQQKIRSPEVFNALLRQQSKDIFSGDDVSGSYSHES